MTRRTSILGWRHGPRLWLLGLLLTVGLPRQPSCLGEPDDPKVSVLEPLPIRMRHEGAVSALAWSPDGKLLASAGEDKTIRLWDPKTGKQNISLDGPKESVWSIPFSPDGNMLAYGSDNQVVLWDVATKKEKARLEGHIGRVLSLAFSPDGKTLASGSFDKSIRLWDLAQGKEKALAGNHSFEVISVAFSPDGKTLASGSWDTTVQLSDAQTGEVQVAMDRRGIVFSVAFSPDGKLLAAGRGPGFAVWDAQTRKEVATIKMQPRRGAVSVAFSPDSKLLAVGGGLKGEAGVVELWDVATGRQRASLKGHMEIVTRVAFSPDGKTLASASYDKAILLWEVPR